MRPGWCGSPRSCALVNLCLASAAWALGFGVGTQASALWLAEQGQNKIAIGASAGAYYLGMALAGLGAPALLRRWGRACPVVGLVLFAGTLACFPLAAALVLYLGLRFLQGAGSALALVPLEAYCQYLASPGQQARSFAYYGVALTLGGALGLDLTLQLWSRVGAGSFLLAAAAALSGAVLVLLGLPSWSAPPAEQSATEVRGRQQVLGYGTGWVQGFLEGGLLTFLPLYLLSAGLSPPTVGHLLGAALAGVLLFQVPLGWLADRLGPLPILLACYGGVALGLLGVPLATGSLLLAPGLLFLGGCSGALFPLGLALLGQNLSGSRLAHAYARYLSWDCLGSVVGPLVMGQAQQWAGGPALFVSGQLALLLVLLLWGSGYVLPYRRLRRQAASRPSAELVASGHRQQPAGDI
jgi:MFS family permease